MLCLLFLPLFIVLQWIRWLFYLWLSLVIFEMEPGNWGFRSCLWKGRRKWESKEGEPLLRGQQLQRPGVESCSTSWQLCELHPRHWSSLSLSFLIWKQGTREISLWCCKAWTIQGGGNNFVQHLHKLISGVRGVGSFCISNQILFSFFYLWYFCKTYQNIIFKWHRSISDPGHSSGFFVSMGVLSVGSKRVLCEVVDQQR